MPRTALVCALTTLVCLITSTTASAQDADSGADLPTKEPALWADHRVHVGLAGGVTWASVEHPELAPGSSFTAGMLDLHAGYQVTEALSLGLEFSAFDKYLRRASGDSLFTAASTLQPQFECATCPYDPELGGKIVAVSATFATVGPRVELSPFGRDGLYVGAFGGLAFVQGLAAVAGAGGAARAGFRLRPVEVITVAVEGGIQGQVFDGGSAIAPYAMLMLRPYF